MLDSTDFKSTFRLLNESGICPSHVQMVLKHLRITAAVRDLESEAEYQVALAALERLRERTQADDHVSDDAVLRNTLAAKVAAWGEHGPADRATLNP